jgi:hypothetical protein
MAIAALPYLVGGTAVGSAYMQIKAGKQQAKGYFAQAQLRRQQGKTEELRYREQALSVLDNILKTDAAILARAGAGGIDPYSGSAQSLQSFAEAKGAQELYVIQDNQALALRTGELEARQLTITGKAAFKQGIAAATSTLVQGAAAAYQMS